LSVGASGEEFSGPEEKSMSNGFRGVVNEGARNGDDGGGDAGVFEKKNGWLFGSRRDGKVVFLGESNSLCVPESVSMAEELVRS
jgi:hypothetical protein